MAWDTEETRRRLLAAAVEEFAAHGLAGTTVDTIARRAGVNKERLYHYFGDKERLFAAVLEDELARIAEAIPLPANGEHLDIGEFAGRAFDYYVAHPHLVRLLHWEGLLSMPTPGRERRQGYYQQKVEAFAQAQRAGVLTDELDPAHLVFLIIAMAAWWFAVPQVVEMLTGKRSDTRRERTAQRAAVVAVARTMASPGTPRPRGRQRPAAAR